MNAYEACDYASDMLKRAGFEHRYTSRKSEACYYGLPGIVYVIRVAAHKHDKSERRHGMSVAARLTFKSCKPSDPDGPVHKSWLQVDDRIVRAVGYYMMRSSGAMPLSSEDRSNLAYAAKAALFAVA